MDDVLYILIGVAWVAFSIYNANQKKKQKAAKAMTQRQPQPMEVPRKKSILEEILMGEEMPAFEEVHSEIEENEEEFVPEYQAAIEYQKDLQERFRQAEQRYTPMEVVQEIAEKETDSTTYDTPVTILKTFNLRQAVIYSMILERPYR